MVLLKQFKISDDVITHIIAEYTKEAGVRQLERVIRKIMRKAIQALLQDKKKTSITVTDELIKEWLGNPTFKKTSLNPNNKTYWPCNWPCMDRNWGRCIGN